MGSALDVGCTPNLAQPQQLSGQECCTPQLCHRSLEPLDDKECADISLVNSVIRGDFDGVKRALDSGASPNTFASLSLKMGEPGKSTRRGQATHITPLMRAAIGGDQSIVTLLLESRASPYSCDSHGWSVLCYALSAGEVAIARCVLDSMAVAKIQKQKIILSKFTKEVVAKCELEVGRDAADRIFKELEPPGVLSLPMDSMPGASIIISDYSHRQQTARDDDTPVSPQAGLHHRD